MYVIKRANLDYPGKAGSHPRPPEDTATLISMCDSSKSLNYTLDITEDINILNDDPQDLLPVHHTWI